MELTIKHFAPYLPYGLKLKEGELSSISHRWGTLKYVDSGNDDYNTSFERVTPILKSITKLDELLIAEFDNYHRGVEYNEKLIDLFCFENIHTDELLSNLDLSKLPYNCIEYMFENHYDVFNLIDNNLAVEM